MIITKRQISDALFDAIVMNDLYEINDENVDEVVEIIANCVYHDLIQKEELKES
ncbi:MAG TPA: hypothetical protein PK335_08635 [Draconibacterium sp.]|nr:hypothetical protein [Draconibacterium sp.]